MYPNKSDATSPVEKIMLQTLQKDQIKNEMLNFDQRLRPPIDFEDHNINFTQSLQYFPEDESKAMVRCEAIKQ